MSDVRPSLENRLSSRLTRSFSPAGRLMERVARHAGSETPIQRANERRLGIVSRLEAFGGGALGALISRLESRGGFRASSPAYRSFSAAEFVTQAPPWMAEPVAEAPAAPVSSPWYSPMRAISPRGTSVASTTAVARQASRALGFGGARRSAMRAPDLVTANAPARSVAAAGVQASAPVARSSWSRPIGAAAVARSASRPVSALSRAAAAGMAQSEFVGARVARSAPSLGTPSVHRALSRAAGTDLGAARQAVSRSIERELPVAASRSAAFDATAAPVRRALSRAAGNEVGAARRAVSRSVASELPISGAGRALSRASEERPSGRGFAVARSAARLGRGAPDLALAQAPVSRSAAPDVEAAPAFSDLSAGWAKPVSRPAAAPLARSEGTRREHVGARVARSLAREQGARRAAARPLARATAASAVAEDAPRSFSPLTSSVRRASAAPAPFVGATVATPVVRSFAGAPTAGPGLAGASSTARVARQSAPVDRALARQSGGINQAARSAASTLPRMATSLSAGSLDIAGPGPLARTAEADAARPMTGGAPSSGWAQPLARTAAPASRPLTRSAAGGSAASLPTSTARVARSTSRPLTGARVARAEYSAFAPAPTAGPASAGSASTARLARAATGTPRQAAGLARSAGELPVSTARVARAAQAGPGSTARTGSTSPLARSTASVAGPASPGLASSAPTAAPGDALSRSTARLARSSRSARVPTAVARAAADSAPFVGARVARSRAASLVDRAEVSTSTVARSFARGIAADPTVQRRFAAAGAPALTLPDAPIASRSVDVAPSSPAVSDLSAGWARPVASRQAESVARTASRAAAALRRSSPPPAARALARYEAPTSSARTGSASYGPFVGARTATPAGAGSASVGVARQGSRSAASGLSRLLSRDATAGPSLSGERAIARSMTSAAALGAPMARRSRLSGIDGTLASAPVARSVEPGPGSAPTERVVQGFARPEGTARVAGPGSALSRSTAPTARALARAGMTQSGARAATPAAGTVQRATQRYEGAARRSDGGAARPLTAARAFDATLPQQARRQAGPASPAPASMARTGWALPRSAASTATSSVTRAVARSGETSTGTATGLGFQSARTVQRRASSALAAPGLPLVAAQGLSRASSAGPALQPGLEPGFAAASTRVARSGWASPLAGPTMTPVRTPALARREDANVARRSAQRASAGTAARSASPALPVSTAPVARAASRSADGAPTARWSTSVFQGAALARAVSRGVVAEDGSIVRRQAEGPAAAAAGWAQPLAAASSAVRRRTHRRAEPGASSAVARAEGGGGFGSDLLVRLKKVQQAGGLGGDHSVARSSGLDAALPSATGMVSRAANQMLARQEEKARRRTQAAMPASTATVSRSETGAMPIADLARMVQRQVAEMTHITAAAPTVSRAARQEIQRSSSAQEAQGRGADRDVGKKPDLDDFLRRAVRRVMVEESIVQSRELSFLD